MTYWMTLDSHVAMLAMVTLGAGWLMVQAGLQKNALERRRKRRVCPACGRRLTTRVCTGCSG